MQILMLFITLAASVLYLSIGMAVLLHCESHYHAAMDDVVGYGITGALICWIICPWTAAAVWSVNRSARRTPGVCE